MASFKEQRELQCSLSGDAFLAKFISGAELRDRWKISESTLRRLDMDGSLSPLSLPGHGSEKHYRVDEVSALEDGLIKATPAKVDPVADARRRQAAFAAFDNIVSHDDKFRAVLERVFVGKLDTDPTFNADAVESLVASERSNYDQVAEIVSQEKTDATMKALFPTSAELTAEHNEIVPPVRPFTGFGLGKKVGK